MLPAYRIPEQRLLAIYCAIALLPDGSTPLRYTHRSYNVATLFPYIALFEVPYTGAEYVLVLVAAHIHEEVAA